MGSVSRQPAQQGPCVAESSPSRTCKARSLDYVNGPDDDVGIWLERLRDAADARAWAVATLRQVDRFSDAHFGMRGGSAEDQEASRKETAHDEMVTEGYLLVMALDRLRSRLARGTHRDLLSEMPTAAGIQIGPVRLRSDGPEPDGDATYIRHVRNAHAHDDEDRRFLQEYGVSPELVRSVDWDPDEVMYGGLHVGDTRSSVEAVRTELERRHAEALGHYSAG